MKLTQEQELYQKIVQRAWEDAQYKKELMANPLAAIEKLTGIKLNIPSDTKIVVNDQTDASKVYINIPIEPNMDDVELNEEQLEAVAGGEGKYYEIIKLPPTFPGGCFPYDK
ncbi:NHLP leader peptide family RiPP precursor [uncultured Kordia sp.]|uniref:NHLP leader peptide family RiPP precursor n=1 Tax=uncultured Kordia sp. TaxID=507699 RepID=UPI002635C634|nr:NHLP leader peptide family RiPP precursor [uncultured Kordia sp.]